MKLLETLQYVGANRRADKTVFEHVLALESAESTAIVSSQQSLPANLATMLQVAGVTGASPEFLQPDSGTSAVAAFAHWFAATTILLQRSAGHDVSLFRVIPGEQDGQQRAWYEYEHSEVGRRAARLALQLIARVIPELELEDDLAGERGENAKLFTEFTQYAAKQALPADTKAIINACVRLDVPCLKLDRDPYEGVSGDFRIRKHGLLKLGHSEYQHIVDGTVCIDRSDSDSPLLHDRDAIFRKLTELDMPVAAQDREFRNCNTTARAARSARRIGYPVVVKPNIRGAGGITLDISAVDSLATAVHAAQESGRQVIVEKFITGDSWKLIIAGGALIAVIAGTTGEDFIATAHASLHDLSAKLAGSLGFGLIVVTMVSTDIRHSLQQTAGAIVDLELAPELDSFLPPGSKIIDLAAEHFVRWIFPENSQCRIPIISIGGTNGKTTTSRMVSRIMQEAGYHTGMALSDGVYINDELVEAGDLAGVPGHLRVLESTEVDCAVLETAMGSLAHTGLIFDWCNVALCTNVSTDHLGNMGINTLQQLADLKRTALERARDAVILNADDEYCRSMAPGLSAREICMTSMKLGMAQLQDSFPDAAGFCVLEQHGGDEHIVFHAAGVKQRLLNTKDIPAGFETKSRFNVNNAMNAAMVCHYSGVDPEQISAALRGFVMSRENTPGRQNIYDTFPFTVLVDYAHNEDGVRNLSEFVGSLDVSGRKIICYAAEDTRSEDEISDIAIAAAGHFNLYICRNYQQSRNYKKSYNRDIQDVPAIMKRALVASGIDEAKICEFEDEREAINHALDIANPGDYVVIQVGNAAKESIHEVLQQHGKNSQRPAPT